MKEQTKMCLASVNLFDQVDSDEVVEMERKSANKESKEREQEGKWIVQFIIKGCVLICLHLCCFIF